LTLTLMTALQLIAPRGYAATCPPHDVAITPYEILVVTVET
jgi:hypothetical protein